ncbi:MAG TPA: cytochrome c oxidase subunit 3 [Deinococcales bacterium]|nr:cytochrome c oxidase subunit 3 [Deinococcales bacterium]
MSELPVQTGSPVFRTETALKAEVNVARVGVILLMVTEFAMFAAFAASDFYLRFNAAAWPPPGVKPPELLVPLINTALLVLSSAAVIWGEAGIKRGNRGRLSLGLGLAALLGAAFLALQVREYARSEFTPSDHTYGSLFFTLTGVHGLHVLTGVLLLLALLGWSLAGSFSARRHALVSNIGLYWHFVTVVWLLLIFPTVYLAPRLG